MGVYPLVVPRDKKRGEHVDNHQYQIAKLVDDRGLGAVCEAPDLTYELVRSATEKRVVNFAQAGPVDVNSGK